MAELLVNIDVDDLARRAEDFTARLVGCRRACASLIFMRMWRS